MFTKFNEIQQNFKEKNIENSLMFNYLKLNPHLNIQLKKELRKTFLKTAFVSVLTLACVTKMNLNENKFGKILTAINLNLFTISYQFQYRFPIKMYQLFEEDPTHFKYFMENQGDYNCE